MRKLGLIFLALAISLTMATLSFAFNAVQQTLLWQQAAVHDGISIDFVANRFYVKPPGQPARFSSFTDLYAFTRNSPATFRGSDGLIQYANENQFLRSQEYDNGVWTKNNITVAANAAAAPDGTLTAESFTDTIDGGAVQHAVIPASSLTSVAGHTYTFSVYAKAISGTRTFWIGFPSTFLASEPRGFFDLSTCSVFGSTGTPVTALAMSVGNGWCRLWVVGIKNSTTGSSQFYSIGFANGTTRDYQGDGTASANVWGSQLRDGNGITQYLASAAAAKYDQPRIDYDSGGNLLGILREWSSGNTSPWSEELNNAVWTAVNMTVTANSIAAPDGNTTAETLSATAGNGYIWQNSVTNNFNVAQRFGVYLKRKTGTGNVSLEHGRTSATCSAINSSTWTRCDVADTALACTYAVVSNVVTVTAIGHGLATGNHVRMDYTSGGAADASLNPITVLTADTFTAAQTTGDTTGNCNVYARTSRIKFATNGDEAYAWGSQTEAPGTVAVAGLTSYIATASTTVTRAQDQMVRTVGAEYVNGPGTIYGEGVIGPQYTSPGMIFTFYSSSGFTQGSNSLYYSGLATSAQGLTYVSTAIQANPTVAQSIGVPFRSIYAYSTNDFALYLNGVLATPDTSGTVPTNVDTSSIGLDSAGTTANQIWIKRLDYYPERKPNAFLKQKTTLGPQSSLKWPSYTANDNEDRKAA